MLDVLYDVPAHAPEEFRRFRWPSRLPAKPAAGDRIRSLCETGVAVVERVEFRTVGLGCITIEPRTCVAVLISPE